MKGGNFDLGYYMLDNKKYKTRRTINKKLYSYYEIPFRNLSKDDTTYIVRPNREKVLVIDSIKAFDIFTNKYVGIDSYDQLYIKWDLVRDDFKGFYIDSNEKLEHNRKSYLIYRKERYRSWWSREYYHKDVIMFR
jgi:hypothetical protein